EDRPLAPYYVVADGNALVIQGTVRRPAFKWLGAMRLPEYNRVDGLRVEVGPSILLPNFAGVEPTLNASIGYATSRRDALGRVQLKMKRGLSNLSVGWEDDVTMTNDEWMARPLTNSF